MVKRRQRNRQADRVSGVGSRLPTRSYELVRPPGSGDRVSEDTKCLGPRARKRASTIRGSRKIPCLVHHDSWPALYNEPGQYSSPRQVRCDLKSV
jgi:hypothetical protein